MKTTIVVIATSRACGFCRTLRDMLKDDGSQSAKPSFKSFAARFPGADFVFADSASDTEAFNRWMAKGRFSGEVPIVAFFEGEKLVKQFVARRTYVTPWTADGLAARLAAECPECVLSPGADPAEPPSDPACGRCRCGKCGCEVNFCPSCGKEL